MSSSPPALPTPRQLLTSILNQISGIPLPTAPGQGDGPTRDSSTITRTDSFPERAGQPPSNPLSLIDPRHRPLFTTLHVLYPSLLLPALDLLDRGLVTRLVSPEEEAATTTPTEGSPLAHSAPYETREEDGGATQVRVSTGAPSTPPLSVYIVRSAQKPTRRPHGGEAPSTTSVSTTIGSSSSSSSSSSQRAYVVHTAAWNCTCAAFAFSAFPPLSGPSLLAPTDSRTEDIVPAVTVFDDDDGDDAEETGEGEGSVPWQFGGVSHDGCSDTGGVPPCCKHLLACVLAERWECGLGKYPNRWDVGRDEMAGVFADV